MTVIEFLFPIFVGLMGLGVALGVGYLLPTMFKDGRSRRP